MPQHNGVIQYYFGTEAEYDNLINKDTNAWYIVKGSDESNTPRIYIGDTCYYGTSFDYKGHVDSVDQLPEVGHWGLVYSVGEYNTLYRSEEQLDHSIVWKRLSETEPIVSSNMSEGTLVDNITNEYSHDDQYIKTTDKSVDGSKTYYSKSGSVYSRVEAPNNDDISTYYEKKTSSDQVPTVNAVVNYGKTKADLDDNGEVPTDQLPIDSSLEGEGDRLLSKSAISTELDKKAPTWDNTKYSGYAHLVEVPDEGGKVPITELPTSIVGEGANYVLTDKDVSLQEITDLKNTVRDHGGRLDTIESNLSDKADLEQRYFNSHDDTVVEGKTYYTYNEDTGVYQPVSSPTGSPRSQNYYEIRKVVPYSQLPVSDKSDSNGRLVTENMLDDIDSKVTTNTKDISDLTEEVSKLGGAVISVSYNDTETSKLYPDKSGNLNLTSADWSVGSYAASEVIPSETKAIFSVDLDNVENIESLITLYYYGDQVQISSFTYALGELTVVSDTITEDIDEVGLVLEVDMWGAHKDISYIRNKTQLYNQLSRSAFTGSAKDLSDIVGNVPEDSDKDSSVPSVGAVKKYVQSHSGGFSSETIYLANLEPTNPAPYGIVLHQASDYRYSTRITVPDLDLSSLSGMREIVIQINCYEYTPGTSSIIVDEDTGNYSARKFGSTYEVVLHPTINSTTWASSPVPVLINRQVNSTDTYFTNVRTSTLHFALNTDNNASDSGFSVYAVDGNLPRFDPADYSQYYDYFSMPCIVSIIGYR